LGNPGLATGSGTADESKEAELASALQEILSSPDEIGFSNGTRTVTITYVISLSECCSVLFFPPFWGIQDVIFAILGEGIRYTSFHSPHDCLLLGAVSAESTMRMTSSGMCRSLLDVLQIELISDELEGTNSITFRHLNVFRSVLFTLGDSSIQLTGETTLV